MNRTPTTTTKNRTYEYMKKKKILSLDSLLYCYAVRNTNASESVGGGGSGGANNSHILYCLFEWRRPHTIRKQNRQNLWTGNEEGKKKEKSSDDDWWSWLWCYDCCLLSSVKWLCFCCAFGHCGATHARMPHTSQTLLDTIKHIYWFSLWKMFSACFVAPSLSHSCYPCVAASAAAAETAGDGQTFVCLLCVRFHNSRMNVR